MLMYADVCFEAGTLLDPISLTCRSTCSTDGFPLSPHFFHVKEKEGFDWLARTHTHVGVRYSIYWLY